MNEEKEDKVVDEWSVGEIGNFCTCLKEGDKTIHFTNTLDNKHCQYCDHLLIKQKVEEKHVRKHKLWVKTKKKRDKIEMKKRERFYEKMELMRIGNRH